jgi:hypothetical protein
MGRRASRRRATFVALFGCALPAMAIAAAHCDGPIEDDGRWNLVCAADAEHESEDDYQCDYIVALSLDNGLADEAEATGSISPGQVGVVIWSSVVRGDDAQVSSAHIVRGSCTR